MSTLLHIASRVEAAVEAFISVRDFANETEWKEKFDGELKNTIYEYRRVLEGNPGQNNPLHPTLVALSIVLNKNEDLGRINRSHPDRVNHTYYEHNADFPADISDLLPPTADRWWEALAEAARRGNAAPNPPLDTPPSIPPRPKAKTIKLIGPKAPEEKRKTPAENRAEDVPMELDEEPKDSHDSQGAAVASKRKQKGPYAASPATGSHISAERLAQSKKGTEPAKQGSGDTVQLSCKRCTKSGQECTVVPQGACVQCKTSKTKCSLMPMNPMTGKTDRRPLSEAELYDFRTRQAAEPDTEVKRGKRRARDSPDVEEEGEDAGPAPSPSGPTIVALEKLNLGGHSGGSSSVNTPADSPATLPQPSLFEQPAPPPAPKRKARKTRKVTQSSAGPSELLSAQPLQASRSSGGTSPASDHGSNTARIAALEKRQDTFEKWAQELETKVSELELEFTKYVAEHPRDVYGEEE